MARRNKSVAYKRELERFGLPPAEFRRLGTTPVDIEAHIPMCPDIYPGPARYRKLLAQSPEQRRAGIHAWHVRRYDRLCAELAPYDLETRYFNSDPLAVRLTVPANKVRSVFELACVDHVDILRIKGGPRKRRFKRSEPRWFAVKARFVRQFEGETRGMQDYEDRIVLVQARSFKDAERKAMREFRQYDMVSLTTTGPLGRWSFETILDVCETFIDTFDPKGTEVYFEIKQRRMQPEYEWHPTGHSP